MSYRSEDTLYPEREYYDPERDSQWAHRDEPDPDRLRDMAREAEMFPTDEPLDDPRPELASHRTGGYVDEYMVRTYGS